MYIGIDFGTTNTVVAVIDDGDAQPRVLALEGASRTLRTAMYVERDQTITIGNAAIRLYREQNVGRVPRFAKQYIGTIDMEMGELLAKGYDLKGGQVIIDVFTDVDADAPGRLLHALKGPLATDYSGTTLFGQSYALEALIGAFLTRVAERVEAQTGVRPRRAVLGRPVHFANAHTDADDARAEARLREAAQLAGFEQVIFDQEPIGAALAFTQRSGVAFVFDFGGGTLDTAVVRMQADGSQHVLATGGIGIAGDHFDQAVFRRVLMPWFGGRVRWGPQRLPLPVHLLDALGDWQNIPMLSNADVLGFLREAQRDCTDPIRLMALEELIAKGYGYDLYEQVERAKVALSHTRSTVIAYEAGAIDVWQLLLRAQFEAIIAQERRQIGRLIDDTLERSGLDAAQIDVVVRTGGSSAIPCFEALLAERFGAAKVVAHELFTGVASGLAVKARALGLNT
jgi:hypothetical chaperone protein